LKSFHRLQKAIKMLYFGPFSLDPERLILSAEGRPLPLGPKVVETLLALAERQGETLTKNELLERVWPNGFVEEGNLAQNVYVLRKVLRAHWHDVIETVPRRGYRFAAECSSEPPGPRVRWYFAAAAACLALVFSFALVHDTAKSRPQPVTLTASGSRLLAIGTYYWKLRTQQGLQKSVRYFSGVVKSDPKNARGYAALAEAYALEGDYGYAPMKQSYARARRIARMALRIDPRSAEAHAAMGLAEDVPGTRRQARDEYRTAVQLDPSYASAHQWYGAALLIEGRAHEGFAELRTATQLDPVSPAALAWLSDAAYLTRNYSDAVSYAREGIDLAPYRAELYMDLGLGYEAMRNYTAAESAYRRLAVVCAACRADSDALLAHAYAAAGDPRRADAALARATQRRMAPYPGNLAAALIALNRRTEALRALRGLTRPDGHVALDPRLDPVRTDPRFKRYTRA
jgi:DNA-binding winged helix-turn-helix (wHTH) protein/Tfp pilus assembly protein PilF